jgi:hypothetical protein
MSKKPTIPSRNGLAKTKSGVNSATSIIAIQPNQRSSRRKRLAAWGGILSLLILAGVGVKFTLKHRTARLHRTAPVEVVSNGVATSADEAPPVVAAPQLNVANRQAMQPIVTREALPMSLLPVKSTAPQLPSVEKSTAHLPIADEPEGLANAQPEPTMGPMIPPALPNAQAVVEKAAPAVRPAPTKAPFNAPLDSFGTKLGLVTKSAATCEVAKKEKKAIFLVRHAGNFENGAFTCDKAEEFRKQTLLNDEVAEALSSNFICVCESISAVRPANGKSGSLVSCFYLFDGSALHVVPGPVSAETLLDEANWVLETRLRGQDQYDFRKDITRFWSAVRSEHQKRYWDAPDDELPNVVLPKQDMPKFGRRGPWRGRPFFADMQPMQNPQLLPGGAFEQFPFQQQPKRLPPKRPEGAAPIRQVHWQFGIVNGQLPPVNDISKWAYEVVLKERIVPPDPLPRPQIAPDK